MVEIWKKPCWKCKIEKLPKTSSNINLFKGLSFHFRVTQILKCTLQQTSINSVMKNHPSKKEHHLRKKKWKWWVSSFKHHFTHLNCQDSLQEIPHQPDVLECRNSRFEHSCLFPGKLTLLILVRVGKRLKILCPLQPGWIMTGHKKSGRTNEIPTYRDCPSERAMLLGQQGGSGSFHWNVSIMCWSSKKAKAWNHGKALHPQISE